MLEHFDDKEAIGILRKLANVSKFVAITIPTRAEKKDIGIPRKFHSIKKVKELGQEAGLKFVKSFRFYKKNNRFLRNFVLFKS